MSAKGFKRQKILRYDRPVGEKIMQRKHSVCTKVNVAKGDGLSAGSTEGICGMCRRGDKRGTFDNLPPRYSFLPFFKMHVPVRRYLTPLSQLDHMYRRSVTALAA